MKVIARPRILGTACLVLVGAALVLTGCSGQASTAGDKSATGGGAATSSSSARDLYDLELAACLRDKGFDIPDPEPGKGITDDRPEVAAAASTCMGEIGSPPGDLSEADMAAIDARYVKWATCFRERGYDVADPVRGEAFAIPETASESDIAACTQVPQ